VATEKDKQAPAKTPEVKPDLAEEIVAGIWADVTGRVGLLVGVSEAVEIDMIDAWKKIVNNSLNKGK
jgi:hypothetical protein